MYSKNSLVKINYASDIFKENHKNMLQKKENLFDISIDAITMENMVSLIDEKVKNRESAHVLGINADKINMLQKNDSLNQVIKKADIIHADGVSILLAARLLNKYIPERIAGIDLMQRLLDLAEISQYPVYFLGAKQVSLNKMKENLLKKWPRLVISGTKNGYFSDKEWANIAINLQERHPQLVFVGITSPKKEYLIDYLLSNGVNAVFIGVGGSFDVLSGEIKRAPLWVQNCHLEWCFRMLQEPKRLFKRYLIGNIKFLKLIFQKKIDSKR